MPTGDLVTLEEAREFLRTGSDTDGRVVALITRASLWLEQLAQRPLAARVFTDVRLWAKTPQRVSLPAWPLDPTAAVTLSLGGTAQTVWRKEADGDPETFDVVVCSDDPWDERFGLRNYLFRSAGWTTGLTSGWDTQADRSPQIRLTYTGGYATASAPADLKQACLYLLQKLWRDADQQRTGLTVVALPSGGSTVIPDPTIPPEVLTLIGPYQRLAYAAS